MKENRKNNKNMTVRQKPNSFVNKRSNNVSNNKNNPNNKALSDHSYKKNNLKEYTTNVRCIRYNDTLTGVCVDLNNTKLLIEVKGIIIGEEAKVVVREIISDGNIILTGKIIELTKRSNDRCKVNCNIYDKCGSCHLLQLNYQKQLEAKKEYVLRQFKNNNLDIKINEVLHADKLTEYRNKLQVAFKMENKKVIYGFYEEYSHNIIPLTKCLVHSSKQLKVLEVISNLIVKLKLSVYDEAKRNGLIRFALIREAFRTNELLVTIVTSTDVFPGRNDFVKSLVKECPFITTIIQNVNSRKTSIVLGEEERTLYGKGYITENILGINFKLSSKSFFQVNPFQTEKLYSKVIEYGAFQKTDTVIDAYCGVGTIGMAVSKSAKKVIGVELNRQAYINAINNAKANNITNITFANGDATDFIDKFADDEVKIDGVIMDPPRSGSTPLFINTVKKLSPKKVVYVSCDAKTLARDLVLFQDKYKVTNCAICDMFVGTYHVETVVTLSKVNDK